MKKIPWQKVLKGDYLMKYVFQDRIGKPSVLTLEVYDREDNPIEKVSGEYRNAEDELEELYFSLPCRLTKIDEDCCNCSYYNPYWMIVKDLQVPKWENRKLKYKTT